MKLAEQKAFALKKKKKTGANIKNSPVGIVYRTYIQKLRFKVDSPRSHSKLNATKGPRG